ncbi:MAG: hypothetical protein WC699_02200 [Bacteroidales bacterium]|jgi:hypothetical protein
MQQASSSPLDNPAHPGKSRRRRQLIVLIACVLIATLLWFLRALENDYTTHVDHPVRYINLPDKMVSLNKLPQRISLEVKGLGFSILRHNWNFSKTPLIIDIKKLKSIPARRKKGFVEYLPMNQYLYDFSSQLSDLKVLSIIPDTLLFRFGLTKTRTLVVKPFIVYESGTTAIADSLIRVNPDSVVVEGPDLILDTMHSVRTIQIKLNHQGSAFSRSVALEEIDKLVRYNPGKVTVSIDKKNRN